MVLGLLCVFLVVSACDELSALTGNCQDQKAQSYAVGTQVDGELSITDCVVTEGSTDYVDYYNFTLDKQTDVTFYYQPENYGKRWSLINRANDVVIINNTGTRTQTQQLAAGTYRIAVKASSANKTGKYVLSTTTPEKGFAGCLTLPEIELGTTLNGEVNIADCFAATGLDVLGENWKIDYYEFKQSQLQPENVTIDIRTSELSFEWYLFTREGNRISNTRSNTDTKQLAPGNYVIAVTGRGTLGDYKLTTTTPTKGFAGCLDLTDYVLGTTINGVSDITDCQGANSNSYVDYYIFTLTQQQNVSFTLESLEIRKYMELYDRGGTRLTETSSGVIPTRQLAPGTYVLLVTGRDKLGTYTLTSTVE
jgi:hypothetical protein